MKDIKTIRTFVETWLTEGKFTYDNVVVNLKTSRVDINGCGLTTDEMYNLEDAITATFKEHLKVSSIESD
jgi:hypothetical protein